MRDEEHFSFPPAKYPVREAVTMSLVFFIIVGLIGWGMWAFVWKALGVWG